MTRFFKPYLLCILLTSLMVLPTLLFAQLSIGGLPQGITLGNHRSVPPELRLAAPDVNALLVEDEANMANGSPERIGIGIKVSAGIENSGIWQTNANGSRIWQIKLTAPDAEALGLYFSHFQLPEKAMLFAYSTDHRQVLGSYTHQNNQPDGLFATELILGESVIIEYQEPSFSFAPLPFSLSEVLYMYRPMLYDSDRTGACQVNTACSEGDNWRDEIKSVVKIMIKNEDSFYWCSGTVLNNTSFDFEPLVLTADHCANKNGSYSSVADVSQWVFYFGYETPTCANEVVQHTKTLTGAVKLASSSPRQNNGSDFYLILLHDNIPADFDPYYAGWDVSGLPSGSGVGIHHPSGDVKKISTYTSPLEDDQWGSTAGTHFKVFWSQTLNGHGTTEGGSSGSPLFNNQQYVVGQLTGGESSCSQPTAADYYGKMSYSWLSNGSHDSVQLQPWLDPLDIGMNKLAGTYNLNQARARFKADTTVIPVGGSLNFTDFSLGNPISWLWEFEGGEPSASNLVNPSGIAYNKLGTFSVKLKVTNAFGADSLFREAYIRVVPDLFPNPVYDDLYLMMGAHPGRLQQITITDILGRVVFSSKDLTQGQAFYTIRCTSLQPGYYFLHAQSEAGSFTRKFLKIAL